MDTGNALTCAVRLFTGRSARVPPSTGLSAGQSSYLDWNPGSRWGFGPRPDPETSGVPGRASSAGTTTVRTPRRRPGGLFEKSEPCRISLPRGPACCALMGTRRGPSHGGHARANRTHLPLSKHGTATPRTPDTGRPAGVVSREMPGGPDRTRRHPPRRRCGCEARTRRTRASSARSCR